MENSEPKVMRIWSLPVIEDNDIKELRLPKGLIEMLSKVDTFEETNVDKTTEVK